MTGLGYRPHPSLGGSGGGGSPPYDDTALVERMDAVEAAVAGKASADALVDVTDRVAFVEGAVGDAQTLARLAADGVDALELALPNKASVASVEALANATTTALAGKASTASVTAVSDRVGALESAFWQGGEQLLVPSQFATLTLALARARSKWRLPGARIEIVVADDAILAEDFQISDPDLSWVIIRPATVDRAADVTGNIAVSGSNGAWSVAFTLPTAADAARYRVGDVGYFYTTDFQSAAANNALIGGWRVTAVAGSTVTLRNTARVASLAPSGIATGRLFRVPVRIDRTVALVIRGKSPVFRDIAFTAPADKTAIDIRGGGELTIWSPDAAVAVDRPRLFVCGGGDAVVVTDFGRLSGEISVTGAAARGVVMALAAAIVGRGFVASGCGDGVVGYGGEIYAEASGGGLRAIACANLYSGISLLEGSCGRLVNPCVQGSAGGTDIYAAGNATPVVLGTKHYGNISPGANTSGNNNSYIRVI